MTQREMARELGVSLGKTNYCLRALLAKGFVKVQNFRKSPHKRGYVYLLTPEGVAAKAELTRQFLARIHSLCRRMLNPELADDVTQDVFVRAWQKLHLFRGEAAFGTWLHRLAINVVLAKRADAAKQRNRFSDDATIWERAATKPYAGDTRMDFEAALAKLPEGAREIFVLHDIEGYKHEEIAGLLGVSAGTSKSQLHRARMALRDVMA